MGSVIAQSENTGGFKETANNALAEDIQWHQQREIVKHLGKMDYTY